MTSASNEEIRLTTTDDGARASDLATLKRLGKRLQRRRQELGLSQEDLCRLAGTNRTYISDIERGVTNVSFIVLKKLSRALNTDVAEITRGLDEEDLPCV